MSNSQKDIPIREIRQLLQQGRSAKYKYGTFQGTAALDDFRYEHLENYDRKIYDNIMEWGTAWDLNENFTLPKDHAVVDDYLLLHSIMSRNCSADYRLLAGRLNFEEVAFAMKKNHDLFPNITRKMTKYGRDGDLTKWRSNEKWSCDATPKNTAQPKVIDVAQMKGLFTILYAAAGVALIESFMGWIFRKWRKDGKVFVAEKEFDGDIMQISSEKLDSHKKAVAVHQIYQQ